MNTLSEETVTRHPSKWTWQQLVSISIISSIILVILGFVGQDWWLHFKVINDALYDSDPPIKALANGNFTSFWEAGDVSPLMLPTTIIIRGIALFFWPQSTSYSTRNAIGTLFLLLPCILILTMVTSNLWHLYKTWQKNILAVAWTLLLTIAPLAMATISFGHPEETFGVCAIIGGAYLLAKPPIANQSWFRQRWVYGALLAAFALTTKQNFWLVFPVFVLVASPSIRWKAIAIMGIVSFLILVSVVVADPHTFFLQQSSVAQGTTNPFAAPGSPFLIFALLHWTLPFQISKYILILIVLGGGILVGIQQHWKITFHKALQLLLFIFLLRCLLDPYVNDYYHYPAFVVMLILETTYIFRHRKEHAPYRWIPLPFGTILWSLLVWQLATLDPRMFFLRDLLTNQREYTIALLYLLTMLVPIAMISLVLFQQHSTNILWKYRRWILYPTVGLLCSIMAVNIAAPPKPPTLKAPQGYYNQGIQPEMNRIAGREPLYWLGDNPSIVAKPIPGLYPDIVSWIAYRIPKSVPESQEFVPGYPPNVTVVTRRTTTNKLKKLIAGCEKQCANKSNHKVITPIGPGIYVPDTSSNSTWTVYVKGTQNHYAIVIGINVSNAKPTVLNILSHLERATPKQLAATKY